MVCQRQYNAFNGHRRPEFFVLRNVVATGPIIGRRTNCDIYQNIMDEWGRQYSYVGIAIFRQVGVYDCDALQTGEFILPPGLVYRLDRIPPTLWEVVCRRLSGKGNGSVN